MYTYIYTRMLTVCMIYIHLELVYPEICVKNTFILRLSNEPFVLLNFSMIVLIGLWD